MATWILALAGLLLGLLLGYFYCRREMARVDQSEMQEDGGKYRKPVAAHGLTPKNRPEGEDEYAETLAGPVQTRVNLHTIVESIEEGILVVGPDGSLEFMNQALLTILDVPGDPAFWQGKRLVELFRMPALAQAINSVQQGPQATESLPLAHGSKDLVVKIRGLPQEGSGTQPVLAIWKDMTTVRRSEQMGRDLVANVAHQLRTPLTSIKGYAETLLDGASSDPELAKRFLETILRNADRLTGLVHDVLTLARIEGAQNRKGARLTDTVDMNDVVTQALDAVTHLARRHSTKLTKHLPPHRVFVAGTAQDIEQAIFNLLDNAVRYSPRGSTVTADLEVDKAEAIVTVRDNGPGIPKEARERIFERFYRLEGDRRESAGTGLGLAIVKQVADSHGGRVWVESLWGKGSAFRLTLPIAGPPQGARVD